MRLGDINISETLERARKELDREENLSPALKATIELLLLIVTLLSQQLGLNSKNSSKPPSTDPNREKQSRAKGERKPGGQPGHEGKTLEPFDDPDYVQDIALDRRTLPRGEYRDDGYEDRQVVDIDINRIVTEYRAQVLINETGQPFVAEFPDKVSRPIQYGDSIKVHAVYLSQFQLLPYVSATVNPQVFAAEQNDDKEAAAIRFHSSRSALKTAAHDLPRRCLRTAVAQPGFPRTFRDLITLVIPRHRSQVTEPADRCTRLAQPSSRL